MAITKLPGYISAVKAYQAPKAVVKAIAPTKAAKVALGPRFGSPLPAGSQPIPNYLMPIPKAAPPSAPAAPAALGGAVTAVPRSAVPGNYEASLADILGQPLSADARGAYNANLKTWMDSLRSGLGQSIIKAGYDPSTAFQKLLADRPDLGEFSNLIDPTAAVAAGQNTLSDRALNEQTYNRGMSNLDYELAARGIEGSGAQATGGNQLTQAKQLQENQTRDALLQTIQSGITGYLGQKTQGYNSLLDTYGQAAQQLAQQAGAVRPEGTETVDEANATQPDQAVVPGTAIPSAANTNYVNWGGQQIKNVTQMRQWLGARGQRWDVWAPQHPDLARQLVNLSGGKL